ncbi:hypothetical protein [Actinomadura rugatobispora]|uniref:Uncharacterized protein n=1 Tax=Actinomadura rugatobispora TaxID=1994 RepID=A0ABW1AFE1_9ACTN|nr:hypothetical protein GCM10010200_020060 [Actinomadura rugatobispora]
MVRNVLAYALLVVPWNVHFQARRLVQEIGAGRARGLEVPPEREAEARRIAARARTAAVCGHAVSAAVVAVIAFFSGAVIGYYFAGFYLLSTFFRPAHAWFAHLRSRLGTMLREVRYPRDDVLDLVERLTFLEGRVEAMRLTTEHLHQADHTLERRLEAVDLTGRRAAADLNGRLDALGRRFETTVAQLTDDQELITGIKAFLRLLRADPA